MIDITLEDLQESVRDKSAFSKLDDYFRICFSFLELMENTIPTRIISPSQHNYIFYQYDETYNHRITRPLNTNLYIEKSKEFYDCINDFVNFIENLKIEQESIINDHKWKKYIDSNFLNKMVYTMQQSIGCIGDSFDNPNQSRKRIGQLFENLVKIIINAIGIKCSSRRINIPIPGYSGYKMSYELDLVFSRNNAIIASETKFIHVNEVVGSVKTTSKDRIDKIFLDKYLLSKLIGREIPVIAIFLHDVQRARRGKNIFGINSTFKSNHFLGYTVALNRLDGVYYVDPRPVMVSNGRLSEQISGFQTFIIKDIWALSKL